MFNKFWLSCLIVLAFALPTLAANPAPFYHSDHRAPFIKMEMVKSSQLRGSRLSGETLALQYLKKNATRYGLTTGLDNLQLAKVQQSLLADHYHFEQTLNGYPVHRGEIIVTIAHETGDVSMVYNNTYPVSRASLHAPAVRLDADDALDAAWNDLRVHGSMMAENKARLAYVPEDDQLRLVYLVDIAVEAPFGYWEHQIDAASGEVMEARNTAISRVEVDELDFDLYTGPVLDRRAAEKRYVSQQRRLTAAKAGVAADATGNVFDPDPVTALQNSSLADNSPASSFSGAYVTRTLQDVNLSGETYSLTGPWVTIANFESPNTSPSTTTNGSWTATRGNNAFNDAMTYFHVDQSQRYMQSLGFSGGTGIQYGSISVDSDGVSGDDNSHFIPSSNRMAFGHGCVDDNEDAFVILHEYGHAIHHSINSNWSGADTGAMGEGFGDYWGGSYRYRTPNGANFNPAWAFPWDGHNSCWGGRDMDHTEFQYDPSKSYPAHATVGGVYGDELWSTPLFQALITLTDQGVAHAEVDQIILQAHFGLGSGVTMRQMATAIVNAAQSLYPSGPHADVFTAKFEAQNILDGGTVPPDPTGTELSNGQTVSNLSGSTGNEQHFFIDVPAGASNLSMAISGGSGDADLYTRFGAAPTTSSYDCRPYASGNNESCPVANPSAGTYYIMIRAYSTYSGLSLSVSYDAPGGSNQAPTAGFSVATSNLTANFSDSSSDSDGSIASRSWAFGDGATSTATNPSHTYASAGTYTVTLTVTDNDGASDSSSQSVTVSSAPGGSWTTISSDNFESGWGTWNDGGSDVRRSANDSSYAHQGTYCVRLRDNTGAASAMASDAMNLNGYSEVRVNFWFYAASMENGEDFFVEYYDGSSWNIVATYARGTDFNNNQFYNPEVTIDGGSYNLGSGAAFRIRCDASGNNDLVYIDEVVISAR